MADDRWRTRRGSVRRSFPVVATVALLALIGVAASRAVPHRVERQGDGVLLANIAVAFAVVVVAVSLVLVVLAMTLRGRSEDRVPSAQRGGLRMLAAIIVFFGLLMLVLRRVRRDAAAPAPIGGAVPPASPKVPTAAPVATTWGLWVGVGIVMAVVLLTIVAGVVARRRRPSAEGAGGRLHADVAVAVGDVVRDVEAERDPRRAVIVAYDGMERVFASYGTTRPPSETPAELLRRAVDGLGLSPEPIGRLTRCYVAARFDVRDIPESMRTESIDALRDVRSELERIAVRSVSEAALR